MPIFFRKQQDSAVSRELSTLQDEVRTLESILGLPYSSLSDFGKLRKRLANLRSLAASKINPADNGEQKDPIIWGDPRYFK